VFPSSFLMFHDGYLAKHVPRDHRGLGRSSITVSIFLSLPRFKWMATGKGPRHPSRVGLSAQGSL